MIKQRLTRRNFFKTTLASITAPYIIPSSALGKAGAVAPSNRIIMGGIGIGSQGMHNLRNFLTCDDLQVLAVCDVDTNHLSRAKNEVDKKYGNKDCARYRDFRELLSRGDIDTVLIATPDHWHALISIAAAQAGKDVYCEKPISLTIAEGRAVTEVMKRYGTVYQSGTQRRSIGCFRFAVDAARSGMIGTVHTLHAYYHNGPTCPPQPATPVPAGFNYDMWLGPAPYAPYTPKRCHSSFRWILDYSGGQLTDLGAHFNDLAQWANDSQSTGPVTYEGWGEFPADGLFNTAIRYQLTATYADGVKLIYHDETEPGRGPRGNKFVGDEGWVSVDDNGKVDAWPQSILNTRKIVQQGYGYMKGHHRNFLDCVRTRAQTIAPPEVAHRSTTTCHLGNICLRLGRKIQWDPEKEQIINDDEANSMCRRVMRSPWSL